MPPWVSSRIGWGLEGRWRYALAGLALLLLVTLGAVGSVLADMHLPGSPSATPTAVASPATDVARAAELIRVWDDWDAAAAAGDAAGGARSRPWVAWWLVVDCAFAVVLGLLVGFTGWARRRKLAAPPPAAGGAQAAVLALLWLVPAMAACYVVLDLVEDLLTGVAVASEAGARGAALGAVRVLSGGKWLALTAAVLPVAASYAIFRACDRDGRRAVVATAMELRPQVVASGLAVSALVLLPANVRTQVHDLMLGWLDDAGMTEAFAAVVVVAVLGAAVWVTGVSALHFAGDGLTASPLSTRRAWTVGATGLALVGLGFVLEEVDAVGAGWVAWVPGGMALGWAVLSIPDPVREVANVRPPLTARPGVLRVLAVLPPFGLLVAWLRAVIPVFDPVLAALSAAGLVALTVAWVRLWRAVPGSGRVLPPRPLLVFGAVLAATGAAPVAAAAASPQGIAPALGGVALVLLGTEVVLGALIVFDSLVAGPPRGPLALVGFRRFPIILAVVVTAATVSVMAKAPGFHEARVEPRPGLGPAREPLSVASALDAWQASPGPPAAAPGDRPWRPLFVLSTAGGGGRAAYWTLLALNCLFADAPAVRGEGCGGGLAHYPSMFAASGISGGSVGLAMFSADPGLDPDEVFADGFVDQVVANLLAVDLPNAFVQAPGWRDRAAVLEQSWEAKVGGLRERFLSRWSRVGAASSSPPPWDPLLLLNSAAVEDGCRLNVSALRVGAAAGTDPPTPAALSGSCRAFPELRLRTRDPAPDGTLPASGWAATRDLTSILCADQDVRLSTAALLSARFPYVSPSGAIEFCDQPGRFTYLIDGGAVDSSAAAPAALVVEELVTRLAASNASRVAAGGPCIQPVVLQLDNGYEDLTTTPLPARPPELVAPIFGGLRAVTNNASTARQQLAELGSTLRARSGCAASVPDIPTFLHVYPLSHPGVEAPLGWSLSGRSREDMHRQLASPANQCSLLTLRYWLTGATGGRVCAVGTVETGASGEGPAAARDVPVCLAGGGARATTDPYGGFVLVAAGDSLPADDVVLEPCRPGGARPTPVAGGPPPRADPGRRLVFGLSLRVGRDPPAPGVPGPGPAVHLAALAFVAGLLVTALVTGTRAGKRRSIFPGVNRSGRRAAPYGPGGSEPPEASRRS